MQRSKSILVEVEAFVLTSPMGRFELPFANLKGVFSGKHRPAVGFKCQDEHGHDLTTEAAADVATAEKTQHKGCRRVEVDILMFSTSITANNTSYKPRVHAHLRAWVYDGNSCGINNQQDEASVRNIKITLNERSNSNLGANERTSGQTNTPHQRWFSVPDIWSPALCCCC